MSAADTSLGHIVVDGSGSTLYMLTADTASSSACTSGACMSAWPPLTTTGTPTAGAGLDQAKLTTLSRAGGRQVVYNGHPLYRYVGDRVPGDVNGQGIKSFGGTWYVLAAPAGTPLTSAP